MKRLCLGLEDTVVPGGAAHRWWGWGGVGRVTEHLRELPSTPGTSFPGGQAGALLLIPCPEGVSLPGQPRATASTTGGTSQSFLLLLSLPALGWPAAREGGWALSRGRRAGRPGLEPAWRLSVGARSWGLLWTEGAPQVSVEPGVC